MTIQELANRDLRKARLTLKNAEKTANLPRAELEHTEELVRLREQILSLVRKGGGDIG